MVANSLSFKWENTVTQETFFITMVNCNDTIIQMNSNGQEARDCVVDTIRKSYVCTVKIVCVGGGTGSR